MDMEIPQPSKIMPRATKGMKDHYAVFIAKLMQARTATHMLHLMTDSYARHKALNIFYDEIGDLLDSIAETALGTYGKPVSMTIESMKVSVDTEEKYMKDLRSMVQEARDMCKSTNLQNEIDNVLTLIDTQLYLYTLG
jgi:DNA-binding ferritin-like protein